MPKQDEKREVIQPRKAVLGLARLLMDGDEAVDIELYANQVKFRFGAIEHRSSGNGSSSWHDHAP